MPLADHAEIAVIEDHGDDREAVIRLGGQLVAVHAEAPGDVDDRFLRVALLGADGGAKAEAHGAEAAGGQELAGIVKVKVLDSPHLVLADVCRHDGVLRAQPGNSGEHLFGGQDALTLAVFRFPGKRQHKILPLLMVILGQALQQQL